MNVMAPPIPRSDAHATPPMWEAVGPRVPGAVLDIAAVSKSFGGVTAVSEVSFHVRAGGISAIIGPNGAGKSTVLNIISGLLRPDSGSISIDGVNFGDRGGGELAGLGVQRTFQHLALFEGLTVAQNIALGCRNEVRSGLVGQTLGLPRARREVRAIARRVSEVMAFLHLDPYRDADVRTLPYGIRKRVELARALAARPRLLLLDEPMAGLGADDKAHLAAFIAETNALLGTTIVLIEHDIGFVTRLAEHVLVLDHGCKIAEGAPSAVMRDPRVIDAYLGRDHREPAYA